ncbi:MAG: phosphoribosyltransferase [Terriglobales bacterium]
MFRQTPSTIDETASRRRRCWTRLLTAHQIKAAVRALGSRVALDHESGPLLLLGLLRGGLFFLADLARAIPAPVRIETVQPQSWGGALQSSGAVAFDPEPGLELKGKHVVLVDDIYDSGRTLRRVWDWAVAQQPRSLKAACLLVKSTPRAVEEIEIAYRGFDIPNLFVVGCGLDWEGLGRNLSDVWALVPGASEQAARTELLTQLHGRGKTD